MLTDLVLMKPRAYFPPPTVRARQRVERAIWDIRYAACELAVGSSMSQLRVTHARDG